MWHLRRQALSAFKRLHRARKYVFQDDQRALDEGRKVINDSFRNNKNETNEEKVKQMIKLANDVEHELLTNVIQARKREKNLYELRITPETTRLDNVVFNPGALTPTPNKCNPNKNNTCPGQTMVAIETEVQTRQTVEVIAASCSI